MGGARGILYFSEAHWIKYKAGIGFCTNNKAELQAPKLLLNLAVDKSSRKLQVFGYSILVIDWMKYRRAARNIHLRPIYEEILSFEKINADNT